MVQKPTAHVITTLAIDETEFSLNLPGAAKGSTSVMMLRGGIFRRFADGTCREEDVVMPPAALEDNSASTLLAAIQDRATWYFGVPAAKLSCAVFSSDSASTMPVVSEHFLVQMMDKPDELWIHARCFMHKLWGAFSSSTTDLDIINPMYCCTCLSQKTTFMSKVRKAVRSIVRAKLRFVWTEPLERDVERNARIIDLLNGADEECERSFASQEMS